MPRQTFIDKFYNNTENVSETMTEMIWVIDELILLEMPDKEDVNTT